MKSLSQIVIPAFTKSIARVLRHPDRPAPPSQGTRTVPSGSPPTPWRRRHLVIPHLFLLALICLSPNQGSAAALVSHPAFGLQIPRGFQVSYYATEALADNITAMAVDSKGRVVVSGPGYIRTLIDHNSDGVADDSVLFAEVKSGAMGMCFDGATLYYVSEGGLYKMQDADLDGRGDGEAQRLVTLQFGEHGAHAIRKGPEGGWYWMAGNDAGVHSGLINDSSSPVRSPQAGALLRLSPAMDRLAVHSHGFRNPYDFDFNSFGDLFTFDSDVERDYLLPWYTPTRLFHIQYGGHHGWRLTGYLRSYAKLFHDPESVEPMETLGRASPTGIVCYRHYQFPPRYQNALFALDWTFGRIWATTLEPSSSTYRSIPDLFAEATSESGFAPTDAVVAPDGSLLVSVGGRNTRGAVYRFSYTAEKSRSLLANQWFDPQLPDPAAVMIAPQPMEAWSRAIWVPLARTFGPQPFDTSASNEELVDSMRIRAIEILTEVHGGMTTLGAKTAAKSKSPFVRARVAWSLGRVPCENFAVTLGELAADANPVVRRNAMEAILENVERVRPELALKVASANTAHTDRRIRQLAAQLAVYLPLTQWKEFYPAQSRGTPQAQLTAVMAARHRFPTNGIASALLDQLIATLPRTSNPTEQLEALDLIVACLGGWQLQQPSLELFTAYEATYPPSSDPALARRLSKTITPLLLSPNSEVIREAARLLAITLDPSTDLPGRLLDLAKGNLTSEELFHLLTCVSKLPAKRSTQVSQSTANTLLKLTFKLSGLEHRPKQNWNDRFRELLTQLFQADPQLIPELLQAPTFPSPRNIPIAQSFGEPDRIKAARLFLPWIQQNPSATWPDGLIELLALLPPPESRALIRAQASKPGQKDAATLALAREPNSLDRPLFIQGLSSPEKNVMEASLQALLRLPRDNQLTSLQAALGLLEKALRQSRHEPTPQQIVALIGYLSGETFPLEDPGGSIEERRRHYQPVFNKCAQKYPTLTTTLNRQATTLVAFEQSLARTTWDRGNSARGEELFRARNCAACHLADRAVGPDLSGITRRFPPNELFRHIWDPNRDIAENYRTVEILTQDGQQRLGVVVFLSADGVLLKDATGTLHRIATTQIRSQRTSDRSLMPEGLLEGLTPSDLADLYAYIKSL